VNFPILSRNLYCMFGTLTFNKKHYTIRLIEDWPAVTIIIELTYENIFEITYYSHTLKKKYFYSQDF